MKLLQQIIDSAVDDGAPLAGLLRKCLVLSNDLKNDSLREWCLAELNGYGDRPELPDYRNFIAESYGAMFGPGGNVVNSQPLSMHVIEERDRDLLMKADFRQGIAEIASLAAGGNGLTSPWPAHLIVKYQSSFDRRWALNRAWQSIPVQWPIGICDTVRTRILQFVLELRTATGDAENPLDRISSREVESKVTTIIFGGQNIVSSHVGGSVSQSGGDNLIAGDFEGLARALVGLGVTTEQVGELQDAMTADAAETGKPSIGSRVGAWISKVSGAGLAAVSGEVLGALIKQHIGMS